MAVFWNCKTTENSDYDAKVGYLSEPSADLIGKFKKEIVAYKDPSQHEAYIPCDHIERSKNHMLFILHGRVEIMIRPEQAQKNCFLWIVMKIIDVGHDGRSPSLACSSICGSC